MISPSDKRPLTLREIRALMKLGSEDCVLQAPTDERQETKIDLAESREFYGTTTEAEAEQFTRGEGDYGE